MLRSFTKGMNQLKPLIIVLLMLTSTLAGCTGADEEEDDEYDVVKTNPPPETDLQPGRIYSDENIYINEDGTGNFRTHCTESHVNNDDPLVYPGQTGAAQAA